MPDISTPHHGMFTPLRNSPVTPFTNRKSLFSPIKSKVPNYITTPISNRISSGNDFFSDLHSVSAMQNNLEDLFSPTKKANSTSTTTASKSKGGIPPKRKVCITQTKKDGRPKVCFMARRSGGFVGKDDTHPIGTSYSNTPKKKSSTSSAKKASPKKASPPKLKPKSPINKAPPKTPTRAAAGKKSTLKTPSAGRTVGGRTLRNKTPIDYKKVQNMGGRVLNPNNPEKELYLIHPEKGYDKGHAAYKSPGGKEYLVD